MTGAAQQSRARTGWEPVAAPDVPDNLILFDGDCVLCSAWVRFVIARDREARFRFVPVQSAYGRVLARLFGINPEDPETNVVVTGGRAYYKMDSTLAVVTAWPLWRWARLARLLPRGLRNWGYDRIARNRYRLFGRTQTCLVPTPDIARRFLTEQP